MTIGEKVFQRNSRFKVIGKHTRSVKNVTTTPQVKLNHSSLPTPGPDDKCKILPLTQECRPLPFATLRKIGNEVVQPARNLFIKHFFRVNLQKLRVKQRNWQLKKIKR